MDDLLLKTILRGACRYPAEAAMVDESTFWKLVELEAETVKGQPQPAEG